MAIRHTALDLARRGALAFCVLVAWAVAYAADRVEPRTALDRPGVYRAGFDLRLTDEQGRPVQATVTVHGGRSVSATTDDSGRVKLRDVTGPGWLRLSVRPDGRLRPLDFPLDGVTNGIADLGTLRLKRNVVITGTVKLTSDGGETTAVDRGRVSLYASESGAMLQSDNVRDGSFRLDDFDVEPMEVEFDDWTSGTPDHRVPLEIDLSKDRHHVELTVDRQATRGGRLRVVEGQLADSERKPVGGQAEGAPKHRIEMRLVDPEGEPIPGVRVAVAGGSWRRQSPRRAEPVYTDEDGRLVLATDEVPERLDVSGPWGLVSLGAESPKEEEEADRLGEWRPPPDVVADINGLSEVEIPVLRRVELEVSGADPRDVAYGARHLDGRWETFDQTVLVRMFDDLYDGFPTLARAELPDRLPRFAVYPPQGPLVFDFTEDCPHTLAVVSKNGPVAGARVDIVEVGTTYLDRLAVNDPQADIALPGFATDADGRLVRFGNPEALYVAYVYADGYDPARTRLRAGSETRLELVERNVEVAFTGLDDRELLRVKVAGETSLVALRRVLDAGRVVVSLAPGTYDVTVLTTDSVVARGTTFVVDGSPRVVDTTVDRRPEVVVRLPELPVVPELYRSREEKAAGKLPADRWIAWASRRAPRGRNSFGHLAARNEAIGTREPPFEVEVLQEPGETATRVRFSGSGRWVVCLEAERRSLAHRYFMEVELPAGERRELRIPPLDASLEGTYEREVVPNTHGVAGPRIMLLQVGGADAGWNVASHFPGQGLLPYQLADAPERHGFAMHNLPAGDYVTFHHLGEAYAWGGTEVALRSGKTATVPSLGRERAATWTVNVVDAAGRPVRDHVLRVRDRMLEAWEAYWAILHAMGISSTGELAADPIPLPPAARLRGEPVTFEPIRPGWVELVLDDPAGPARHFLRKAEPGGNLTLVVDD